MYKTGDYLTHIKYPNLILEVLAFNNYNMEIRCKCIKISGDPMWWNTVGMIKTWIIFRNVWRKIHKPTTKSYYPEWM